MSASLGNILVVDSDDNIADLLKVNLSSEGYSVDRLRHASEVDRANLGETRLVIVDSMREEYSGMDLVYDLKDDPETEHIGIILYSPFNGERMVIDALDAGADDYIVKPFSLREMVARVRSVLRRRQRETKAPRGASIEFEGLAVDLRSQTVTLDGRPVALSRIEYSILVLLLKSINSYVTRVEIHRRVWNDGTAGANERIVDTNISRLRKKLGNLGDRIVNRSGHGYMIS
ncbi:MAG: response regulator transcription factor [Muribaculaceae bacterium]|nr:response regulator transcription factor [Muribaculaceae bacterium]